MIDYARVIDAEVVIIFLVVIWAMIRELLRK
jgi:hypothetical protein